MLCIFMELIVIYYRKLNKDLDLFILFVYRLNNTKKHGLFRICLKSFRVDLHVSSYAESNEKEFITTRNLFQIWDIIII